MTSRFFFIVIVLLSAALPACDTRQADAPGLIAILSRTGAGPGELSYPRAAVAAADGEHFYVVDKTGRIQRFDTQGNVDVVWHMPQIDAGKPTGLGRGPHDEIFAADTHYGRVMQFDARGRTLATFGTFGLGPGRFRLPTDVAVDADGAMYVSEYGGNDRISKFDRERNYLFSFAEPGSGAAHMERPQSLVFAPDGTLWVSDAGQHRICHFTRDGHFLGAFGRLGEQVGELRFPYGLDLLSDGTLVVAEYGNNRIQRFRGDGTPLGVWGRAGRGPGELAYPWAVVALRDDKLAVIDSGNNRIQLIDARASETWRQ